MTIQKRIFMLTMIVVAMFLVGCVSPPVPVSREVSVVNACDQVLALQHKQQGITYSNAGDFNNAISEFNQSIAVCPTSNTYANLGGAYMQVGKNNKAKQSLNQAMSYQPPDTLALYNLTALHSKMGDTDLALEYLDRTLRSGFKNYDAIRFDPDLTNLRGEPEFRKVLEKNKIFIQ